MSQEEAENGVHAENLLIHYLDFQLQPVQDHHPRIVQRSTELESKPPSSPPWLPYLSHPIRGVT